MTSKNKKEIPDMNEKEWLSKFAPWIFSLDVPLLCDLSKKRHFMRLTYASLITLNGQEYEAITSLKIQKMFSRR